MLKKNCHLVFGSQKSKPTLLELVFQTAGAINPPPPTKIGLKQITFRPSIKKNFYIGEPIIKTKTSAFRKYSLLVSPWRHLFNRL